MVVEDVPIEDSGKEKKKRSPMLPKHSYLHHVGAGCLPPVAAKDNKCHTCGNKATRDAPLQDVGSGANKNAKEFLYCLAHFKEEKLKIHRDAQAYHIDDEKSLCSVSGGLST